MAVFTLAHELDQAGDGFGGVFSGQLVNVFDQRLAAGRIA